MGGGGEGRGICFVTRAHNLFPGTVRRFSLLKIFCTTGIVDYWFVFLACAHFSYQTTDYECMSKCM